VSRQLHALSACCWYWVAGGWWNWETVRRYFNLYLLLNCKYFSINNSTIDICKRRRVSCVWCKLYTGCPMRNVPDFGIVPYVKLYRYNPKQLYPKLNGYGDNGQRVLKLWQLLLTYWLPNTYWNWQVHVISVMLIAVRNIKVTCEWHKAIKLNYKNTRTGVIVVLRLPSILRRQQLMLSFDFRATVRCSAHAKVTIYSCRAGALDKYDVTDGVQYFWNYDAHTFLWPLSP